MALPSKYRTMRTNFRAGGLSRRPRLVESRRESISKHLIGEHTRATTRNAWTTSCFVTTYVNDIGDLLVRPSVYTYIYHVRIYIYVYIYAYMRVSCMFLHPSLFPRRLCAWADRNPFQEGISRVAIEGNVSRKPSG